MDNTPACVARGRFHFLCTVMAGSPSLPYIARARTRRGGHFISVSISSSQSPPQNKASDRRSIVPNNLIYLFPDEAKAARRRSRLGFQFGSILLPFPSRRHRLLLPGSESEAAGRPAASYIAAWPPEPWRRRRRCSSSRRRPRPCPGSRRST